MLLLPFYESSSAAPAGYPGSPPPDRIKAAGFLSAGSLKAEIPACGSSSLHNAFPIVYRPHPPGYHWQADSLHSAVLSADSCVHDPSPEFLHTKT